VLVTLALLVVLVTGCSEDGSEPRGPGRPTSAALRVTSVPAGHLDERARARLESEVSDVLAAFVRTGFLGSYPRSDFVQSFADFTSGAAKQGVRDIDVLTASRFGDASSVRPTDLRARLSFLVAHGQAVGATAWIDFAFRVDDHGVRKQATLQGRLVLERLDGRWSVFGYDVRRHDSDALPAEVSSP
jgi:hypothetical protein